MKLWIRSQDKTKLVEVNQLEIRDDTYSNIKSGYSVASINFENTYGYNFINLGTYKTKERALEVLDEIKNKLLDNVIATNENGHAALLENTCLYEMPKV